MSTPDSFIDEVTEAVRRDKLYAAFRKYGWIGGLVILVIVGGVGWTEYGKSRADARAQAFGDALIDAVDLGDAKERLAAVAAIPADGGQVAIRDLLQASVASEDRAATLAALDKLAADVSVPEVYRDLAVLRKVLFQGSESAIADRRAALQSIAVPGRALRVLAEEQLAYLLIEEGKPDQALAALSTLYQDQESPQGLLDRVGQAILALGGTVPERAAPAAPVDAG